MYQLRDRGSLVTEVLNLLLILMLAMAGYAAGRLHGQLGYRHGYRYGYRQGYFDGDRASWNRRRRELQAAVASVLTTPAHKRAEAFPSAPAGRNDVHERDLRRPGFRRRPGRHRS